MNVLHQATASDTGTLYTWEATAYDAGAGYPGTGTPENILVIAGMGPGVVSGASGTTWETGLSAEDNTWVACATGTVTATGLERCCAVASDGTHRVMYSDDGITWTAATLAEQNTMTSIAWMLVAGVGTWVAVSLDGTYRCQTSTDCVTWTGRTISAHTWSGICLGIAAGTPTLMALARDGASALSTYGKAWTDIETSGETRYSCGCGNGVYVAIGSTSISGGSNGSAYSTDLVTWIPSADHLYGTIDYPAFYGPISYGDGLFVTTGHPISNYSSVAYSTDGSHWTTLTLPAPTSTSSVFWTGRLWVVGLKQTLVSNASPVVATSPDGRRWTYRPSPVRNLAAVTGLAKLGGRIVGVLNGGAVGSNSRAIYCQQ